MNETKRQILKMKRRLKDRDLIELRDLLQEEIDRRTENDDNNFLKATT